MYLPISMGPFMAFSKVTTLYFKLRTKLLKIKKFPKNVPLFKYFFVNMFLSSNRSYDVKCNFVTLTNFIHERPTSIHNVQAD